MELRKIDKKSKDLKEIKSILKEAFPPEERPPFRYLVNRLGRPGVDLWAAYEEERLIGLSYVLHNSKIAYMFFLAIRVEERGKGYGGILLEMLKEQYKGSKFYLAVETLDPKTENYEQRVRRFSFYKRHGLKEQPYQIKEVSVTYDGMGLGGVVTAEEHRELMDNYLGPIQKHLVDMRLIEKN